MISSLPLGTHGFSTFFVNSNPLSMKELIIGTQVLEYYINRERYILHYMQVGMEYCRIESSQWANWNHFCWRKLSL
jgi:hypothetical protein